jgi:hypothetical protein
LEIFSLPVIDIPGFGAVQADNFASEQTLNRLVDAVNNMNQGAGGVQSIFAAVAGDSKRAARDLKQLGAAADSTKGSMEGQASAAEALTRRNMQASNSFASFSRKMSSVSFESPIAALSAGVEKFTGFVGEHAGKITAAGAAVGTVFGGPAGTMLGAAIAGLATGMTQITGGVIGLFLGDLQKMSTEFGKAQQSGAIFGNSMLNFRNIASNSGLTMQQFGNILTKNSEAVAMFGGTTSQGAQEFARANSLLIRTHGNDLQRLGVSYEEMGMRTADFMASLVEAGVPIYENGVATQDVVRRTKELAVQQKALAAINGTTIDQEKEKQRMQRKDAQMNAVLMGLNEKEREVVQQLSAQFPQATQFIKEFVAFGGPVTKEGNLQAAMMGTLTSEIGNTITAVKNGQSVPGALGALENLAASSPQIAAETRVMADMVKLSIAGSTNSVVQMAEKNFNAQFELMNKTQAGVVQNVLDTLTPDLKGFKNAVDPATEAVVKFGDAFQRIQTGISNLADAVYRGPVGNTALAGAANTLTATSNVVQAGAAEFGNTTAVTGVAGTPVDVTRQGFAGMQEGGPIDKMISMLPDSIEKAVNNAMSGISNAVTGGNTVVSSQLTDLVAEQKKTTEAMKRLVDATKMTQ